VCGYCAVAGSAEYSVKLQACW